MIPRLNSLLSKLLSCARARVISHLQSKVSVWTTDTQNSQLSYREEIFTESDKKCIKLELQTTPLNSAQVNTLEFEGMGLVERILPICGQLSFQSPQHFNYTSAKFSLPEKNCQNSDANRSDAFMTVWRTTKNNQQRNPLSKPCETSGATVASVNNRSQRATRLLMRHFFSPQEIHRQDKSKIFNMRNNVKNLLFCLNKHNWKDVRTFSPSRDGSLGLLEGTVKV